MLKTNSRLKVILLTMFVLTGSIHNVFIPVNAYIYAATSDFAGGSGKQYDPYLIATADQLNQVRNYSSAGTYFELTANIDLSGYPDWTPIGTSANRFQGNLDGKGHTISNLTIIGQNDLVGLFGFVGENARLMDIRLDNVKVSGKNRVGALAGRASGSIVNIHVTGLATVTGSHYVGGIVGELNNGHISESHATAEISGTTDVGGLIGYLNAGGISYSYARGDVTGKEGVGGLFGYSSASHIANSYATGHVSANQGNSGDFGGLGGHLQSSRVSNSYATGSVNGGESIGGLLGFTNGGEISNSFALGRVQGTSSTGGMLGYLYGDVTIANVYYATDTTLQNDTGKGEGRTSAELMQQSTFSGWNQMYWDIVSGKYPVLREPVRLTPGTLAGTTKLDNLEIGMAYAVNDAVYTETTGAACDNISVYVGDVVGIRFEADHASSTTLTVKHADIQPAAAPVASLVQGSTVGTARLTGVSTQMAYRINGEDYQAITATNVDNLVVVSGDKIYVRLQETALLPASMEQLIDVEAGHIKSASLVIATSAIAGVTPPVRGETPVTTLSDTNEYTTAISWSPADSSYAANTAYTATITLTPKAGYTLAGVPKNFFTVAGATTTNAAGSGVITAVFPATGAEPVILTPIATPAIAGVTPPVRGATPVSTLPDTNAYTAAISWSPADASYAANTAYTATITLMPKAGYTLTGVPENFFTVAGATATNAADSGVITAVFPPTEPYNSGGGSVIAWPQTSVSVSIPAGQSGALNWGDELKLSVPAGASDKFLRVTIDKLANTSELAGEEMPGSAIFRLSKNVTEKFRKPVHVSFKFDPTQVGPDQRPAIFYYEEADRLWLEVEGSQVDEDQISVTVDELATFAVFVVDKSTEENGESVLPFRDIAGHWAEPIIEQAVQGGIVSGYADGTFQPNGTVTRAEFTVMLMRALQEQGEERVLAFVDAPTIGAWARQAIGQAVEEEIIRGYADNTFRPQATITRAEMAVMIAKALHLRVAVNATPSFADDQAIPGWAKGAVAATREAGLIQGRNGKRFDPYATATRAEAVTILVKLLEHTSN